MIINQTKLIERPKRRLWSYKSRLSTVVLLFLCGIAGGYLGNLLASTFNLAHAAEGAFPKQIEAGDFRLVRPDGKLGVQLGFSAEGPAGLFVYDSQQRARLVAGTYTDGDPFIVLNDEQGRAVAVFRLAGSQHSPVLVFKANGQDRMVLGLGMNSPEQEPFLVTFDKSGNKTEHFGRFDLQGSK